MLSHQLVSHQIADACVKLGRALQVCEKESETDDLEALVDGKRVGAMQIAECLIGEDALGREVGPTLADDFVKGTSSRARPPATRARRCGS